MLAFRPRRVLSLGDHRPGPRQPLVRLDGVVGDIRPRPRRVSLGEVIERPLRGIAPAGESLEPRDRTGEKLRHAGFGSHDTLEQCNPLSHAPLRLLDMLRGGLDLTGIEELHGNLEMLAALVDMDRRIGSRLGEEPALGPLRPNPLLEIIGLQCRLPSTVVAGVEEVDPAARGVEPPSRFFHPGASRQRIALQLCPRQLQGMPDFGERPAERRRRTPPFLDRLQPLASRCNQAVELASHRPGRLVGVLELIERGPAFPRYVVERRLRSRRIEHPDRLLGLCRAERPLRLNRLVGLLPDIHQFEPALAVAVERRLHPVIGAARLPFHRREEVGIGVGEHAVSFLLGIEQVGEGDHLALELREFLPRLARPPRVLRPLHGQRPKRSQPRQRRDGQRECPRAKHPIGLPARHLTVAPFLDPRLGGLDERYQAGIDAPVLRQRLERLTDDLRFDRPRIEAAAGLQAPRRVHRHPLLVDIDIDEHVLRRIEGRLRGAGGDLAPPAGEDRVEDLARRPIPFRAIADNDHAVIPPCLALDAVDGGTEIVERIGHPRHIHVLV